MQKNDFIEISTQFRVIVSQINKQIVCFFFILIYIKFIVFILKPSILITKNVDFDYG